MREKYDNTLVECEKSCSYLPAIAKIVVTRKITECCGSIVQANFNSDFRHLDSSALKMKEKDLHKTRAFLYCKQPYSSSRQHEEKKKSNI
jgi:hypothetical protein